jgi:hypothetical protein
VIWQLNYLEEDSPTYHHIPGKHNFLADSSSYLPHHGNIDYPLEEEKERLSNVNLDSFCTSILNNPKLIGCF